MEDHPPRRYMGVITILIVGLLVVGGSAFIAMQMNERPEQVAGRAAQDGQTEQSESSTAQNPRRSEEQRRGVPGLPQQ